MLKPLSHIFSGTYMNTTGAAQCEICPAGYYCVDSAVWPVACPPGEICPGNTGYDTQLCPQVLTIH